MRASYTAALLKYPSLCNCTRAVPADTVSSCPALTFSVTFESVALQFFLIHHTNARASWSSSVRHGPQVLLTCTQIRMQTSFWSLTVPKHQPVQQSLRQKLLPSVTRQWPLGITENRCVCAGCSNCNLRGQGCILCRPGCFLYQGVSTCPLKLQYEVPAQTWSPWWNGEMQRQHSRMDWLF